MTHTTQPGTTFPQGALVLGVDTSNYATSLAVVQPRGREVVCAKKRLLPVEKGKLGLRQSDAVFHHTVALPALLAELWQEVDLTRVAAVGVSKTPRTAVGSYMPCFLAGVSFASAFAAAGNAPLVHTSHQQGHVAAARFGTGIPALEEGRALVFHFSGGTTELLLCDGYNVEQKLGESLDLYAGQAVDRLGVKLGFGFPAGAELSRLAAECGEEMRPRVSLSGMNCHLSGLQNQCEGYLAKGKPPAWVAKYCLLAMAETLRGMLRAAREIHPGLPAICAGGVLASDVIKTYILERERNITFVPPALSSDNAVGTALIAAKEAGSGEHHRG